MRDVTDIMTSKVANDHLNCDFYPNLQDAPKINDQREISASGKYRFINASTSTTMMEKNTAVVRWYHPLQKVDFNGYEDNGNRLNRYWVKFSFPRQHPRKSSENKIILPPKLSIPGFYQNIAQVDIKAAYFTILSIIGMYPNVMWGVALGVGSRLDTYPFAETKIVRNSLYGTAFNPHLRYVTGSKLTSVQPGVKLSNPHLVQITQCIMHSIARKAREMGAVQWHTDGGILPEKNVYLFMAYVAETYGLTLKLKCTGEAAVFRPDQYITAVHSPRRKLFVPLRIDTIDGFKGDYNLGIYESWLIDHLKSWVRKRGKPGIVVDKNP